MNTATLRQAFSINGPPPDKAAKPADFTINKPFFLSPPAPFGTKCGRRITAGFSYIQRIGKAPGVDVWFPDDLKRKLDAMMAQGQAPGVAHFPAEWAALRQFELLQEAGNYKVFDLDVNHLERSMVHLARDMRAGGYRVTVASLGSYTDDATDDLHILDTRLQDRLSQLIRMLYLEQQSAAASAQQKQNLASGNWDYREALPHIGAGFSARDVFRPLPKLVTYTAIIPATLRIDIAGWAQDNGVRDAATGDVFTRVTANPQAGQYSVADGAYLFHARDVGREVAISYSGGKGAQRSAADRRHHLARQFFNALSLLPHSHIAHDTAIGLQLPEFLSENEWIYLAPGDETLGAFNSLLNDVFAPFNRISLGGLHDRMDAGSEVKATVNHLRSYGDRLTPGADQFYRGLAQYGL